jgi:hypothetical protein
MGLGVGSIFDAVSQKLCRLHKTSHFPHKQSRKAFINLNVHVESKNALWLILINMFEFWMKEKLQRIHKVNETMCSENMECILQWNSFQKYIRQARKYFLWNSNKNAATIDSKYVTKNPKIWGQSFLLEAWGLKEIMAQWYVG